MMLVFLRHNPSRPASSCQRTVWMPIASVRASSLSNLLRLRHNLQNVLFPDGPCCTNLQRPLTAETTHACMDQTAEHVKEYTNMSRMYHVLHQIQANCSEKYDSRTR